MRRTWRGGVYQPTIAREFAPKRDAGCGGKRAYPTFAEASRVARNLRRHTDAKAGPYHCRLCGGFHIGEPDGRDRRQAG